MHTDCPYLKLSDILCLTLFVICCFPESVFPFDGWRFRSAQECLPCVGDVGRSADGPTHSAHKQLSWGSLFSVCLVMHAFVSDMFSWSWLREGGRGRLCLGIHDSCYILEVRSYHIGGILDESVSGWDDVHCHLCYLFCRSLLFWICLHYIWSL